MNLDWYSYDKTLQIGISKNLMTDGNVIAFDLDWTLIRPINGSIFPKDNTDVEILPGRKEKLRSLNKTIIIISNQKGNYDAYKRVDYSVGLLGIKCVCFISLSDDKYRKPNTGICSVIKIMIPIKTKYLYCGDMESDMKFADNCNLNYIHPNNYFDNNIEIGDRSLVILVGAPGSGKSTLAKKLSPNIISSDQLKSVKKKIDSEIERQLQNNINKIVVDATHPTEERRKEIYQLGRKYNYNVIFIHVVSPNAEKRHKNIIAVRTYFKRFEPISFPYYEYVNY